MSVELVSQDRSPAIHDVSRFRDPETMTTADTSVMIEKFAALCGAVSSEFLDLNHTSKISILVSRF